MKVRNWSEKMDKIVGCLLIAFMSFFSNVPEKTETVYSGKWRTSVEVPFSYTKYITTGDHGLILEGKQMEVDKGRPVNYALVVGEHFSERLISYKKIYGDQRFKVKLTAPKATKCKIRIFVYGSGVARGIITASPY
jgi:hypothetical protein